MERRTVSELKEHFQKILRIAENDEKLVIIHAEETEGSKVGENYMSVVLRTRVTGKKGNGEFYSDTFMTKHYPRHRFVAAFGNAELFKNEAHIYNNILPKLCDIAPRCILANEDEIIMEDLKSFGYDIQPRKELLDYEHCAAVIQTLAMFHASSLALKFKNQNQFRQMMAPLTEAIFPKDGVPCLGTTIDSGLTVGINHLKSLENPDEELLKAIDHIEGLIGKSFGMIRNLVTPGNGKYDVMTHGDAWVNNLLFKHDDEGHVADVKLIDFQVARHVSPAIDFHYFMYSSPKSDVIQMNYDDLIDCYHKTLIDNLKKLKFNDEDLVEITKDWFVEELRKHHYYGIIMSFWLVNAVLAEEDDIVNMDDITAEHLEGMETQTRPIRRIKALRMKSVLLHWFKRYQ